MDARGKKLKKLKIPYCPSNEENKGHFEVSTIEEKIICDYTNYDFDRINDLNIFEYWLLLRDAVVYNHLETEEGREYLEKCWRMEQTTPDRKALRNIKLGKEGGCGK